MILNSPARVGRKLGETELAMLGMSSASYVHNHRRFSDKLRRFADQRLSAFSRSTCWSDHTRRMRASASGPKLNRVALLRVASMTNNVSILPSFCSRRFRMAFMLWSPAVAA